MPLLICLPLLFLSLVILDLPLSNAQTIDQLKAGVVKIRAKTGQVGTGFILRIEQEKVFIITVAHVIAGDSQPEVEFFSNRNVSVKSAVLPGAELNDDLLGLALVVVKGKVHIPDGVMALPFGKSVDLVAGGEEALVIGHPSSGGDWAILKRHISNRIGRDIALYPNVKSGFSGGPIIVGHHVVGIVMSKREGFGITHKSVLNYLEGY
jgi:S1-C subfamily serine protease